MSKLDRQIGILTILLRHKRVTTGYLAERFDVSVRTIQRDLDSIAVAGIPLTTLQGPSGGVEIMDGYSIERSVFTVDEIETLLSALRGTDSILTESYTERLMEKLSEQGVDRSFPTAFEIDLGDRHAGTLIEKIREIRKAIANHQCVAFTYSAESGDTERIVEPCRLLFRWGNWYLFAFCRLRGDYRLFKLQRLWSLNVTDCLYTPRAEDHLPQDWDECFIGDIDLVAVFDPCVRYRLIEEYDPSMLEQTTDGRFQFRFRFAFTDHLVSWLLSFGSHVEIVAPDEIRHRVVDEAISLIARNNHDKQLS